MLGFAGCLFLKKFPRRSQRCLLRRVMAEQRYVCIACMYYVCMACMYCMYVLCMYYVCMVCMACMYGVYVWLLHVADAPGGNFWKKDNLQNQACHFFFIACCPILIPDSEST